MASHPLWHYIKKRRRGGNQAGAKSVTPGKLNPPLALVVQRRDPNDSVRLHFCNTESLSMSGRREPDETLHSQHSSKGTNPFPEPEDGEAKKKEEKS